MKLIFWISFVLIVYTYIGYAVLLWLQSKLWPRPILQDSELRTVSIVIAAHNEEANLRAKLQNLRSSDYPEDKLEIVISSDGSTDKTNEILLASEPSIKIVLLDEAHGKAYALNEAVKRSTGQILVFQDSRQAVEPAAVERLVSCFGDPAIGAVSGELVLTPGSNSSADGVGLYWKIEKTVRKLESATGSTVGVTGAIYAIRRELYTAIPEGTILDDVFIPMHVARIGKRVVFQPLAVAKDQIFSETGKEFARKIRTLTGNYQLVRTCPWLISFQNPLLFRFVSHKLLRLIVPFSARLAVAGICARERSLLSSFILRSNSVLFSCSRRNGESVGQEI